MSAPGDAIIGSWSTNAEAWTTAVREGHIASRKAGTDAAIVAAVRDRRPTRALDVGCGEGWLVRALTALGIEAHGSDVSPELVAAARAAGSAHVSVASYADIVADRTCVAGPWDVIVCNFALLDADVVPLLSALGTRLEPDGALVIQTVHPWMARGDAPYEDGWRTETFAAFAVPFPAHMPWYYRTMASWSASIAAAGLRVERFQEPLHPETGLPLSLLLNVTRP
jgi:2-polyprenyl-3-methyl-5-hydroxy-6-metoxy-1,4-benzoquinol methylase